MLTRTALLRATHSRGSQPRRARAIWTAARAAPRGSVSAPRAKPADACTVSLASIMTANEDSACAIREESSAMLVAPTTGKPGKRAASAASITWGSVVEPANTSAAEGAAPASPSSQACITSRAASSESTSSLWPTTAFSMQRL